MTEEVKATQKATGMFLDNCFEDWKSINWKEIQDRVRRLRQRIYRVSVEGDMENLCMLHAGCHRQIHSKYGKQLKPLRAA